MSNFNLTALDHADNSAIRNYPGYNNGKSQTARLKRGDYRSQRYDHCFVGADVNKVIEYALSCLTDPTMLEIEQKEAAKIGPFNRDPYEVWKGKVEAYYEPTNWTPDEAWLAMASTRLYREIREEMSELLVPITVEEAILSATHGKNLGMPYGNKNWKNDDCTYTSQMLDYMIRAVEITQGKPEACCVSVLGHRSQPGGLDTVKNRPTMMADHAETFAALTLQRVLMPVLAKVPAFCGFLKYEDIVKAMGPLFVEDVAGISYGDDAVLSCFGTFYSLDYEAFDASCKKELMHIVLDDVIRPLFAESAGPLIDALKEIYVNIPLWTPDGVMRGEHGLFSGVTLTSIIGTLVNRLFFHYLEISGEIKEGLTPETIQAVAHQLGLKMNPAKQYISKEEFDFCQRRYSRSHRDGKFSIMRTLGRCIFQEGWIQKEDAAEELGVSEAELDMTSVVLLRIMVKLENTKFHPDHEWLVKFVRANEDHLLDTSIVLQAHKLKKLVRSRQDSDCGLEGFSSFRIIKALETQEEPKTDKHMSVLVTQQKVANDNLSKKAEKAAAHAERTRLQQEAAVAKKAERAARKAEQERKAKENASRRAEAKAEQERKAKEKAERRAKAPISQPTTSERKSNSSELEELRRQNALLKEAIANLTMGATHLPAEKLVEAIALCSYAPTTCFNKV
jgi:hypothetical protein